MRILMVLMGLEIGGAETHVVELSKELARRGHTITVVSNGGVYEQELAEAGIQCYNLPLHSRDWRKMRASYRGLKKILQHNRFDLVHAHARIPGFICGLLQKKLKFRFMTTTHWVFKTGFFLNLMTNWGERTIAVSDDIKDYLIKNYKYPKEHISVTINGIDTEKFSPDTTPGGVEQEFRMGQDKKRIVYVSRMDTDRSAVAFHLLDIAPRLYEKYPDLEIVIVGGGNDFNRLKEKVEETNRKLGSRVVIATGARTDISNFIACGSMFIGVSRAVLEAMAAARPVIIAGNEGYIGVFGPDKLDVAIETNYCCRGCEMPTNEALFRDVCAIWDLPPDQQAAMGQYNRQVILENYSVSKMVDDYEAAYRELLSYNPYRPNDVVISGYYGYKNIGDDSLLQAIIQNLRERKPDLSITVLSAKPSQTAKMFQVDSIYRFNIVKIPRLMKRSKLLISGGGSLLQDVTSNQSIYYYAAVIQSAVKHGVRIMVYANGIGPIRNPQNQKLCKDTLERVDAITLRESNSKKELERLGLTKQELAVTADPAFSLKPSGSARVDEIYRQEGLAKEKDYFILSVREWKNKSKLFLPVLRELCEYICEKYGFVPLIIPMQRTVDTPVCKKLQSMLHCESVLLQGCYNANNLLGLVARCKFSVGMRLHILIYSLSVGTPVIGLSYDPKIDAMLESYHIPLKNTIERPDIAKLKAQVDEIVENRDKLSQDISAVSCEMREKTQLDAQKAIAILTDSVV